MPTRCSDSTITPRRRFTMRVTWGARALVGSSRKHAAGWCRPNAFLTPYGLLLLSETSSGERARAGRLHLSVCVLGPSQINEQHRLHQPRGREVLRGVHHAACGRDDLPPAALHGVAVERRVEDGEGYAAQRLLTQHALLREDERERAVFSERASET